MEARSDILLVEDNPDDVDLILRALRRDGVTGAVMVVRDGQEALNLLFGPPTPKAAAPGPSVSGAQAAGLSALGSSALPRVIVLDVKLPRVDGLEVLRKIRLDERTRKIPVVMLSSSNQDQDISNAYSLGANSYVVKPVKYEEFARAVSQVGRYWLGLNQYSCNAEFA